MAALEVQVKEMELPKEYIPLISSALGAVFALAGVFISSFINHNKTFDREKYKLCLEKAEFLYVMILKLDQFVGVLSNNIAEEDMNFDPPQNVSLAQHEYEQILMLTELYLPKLAPLAKKYIECKNELMVHFAVCLLEYEKNGVLPNAEQKKLAINLLNEYRLSSDEFKNGVSSAIK